MVNEDFFLSCESCGAALVFGENGAMLQIPVPVARPGGLRTEKRGQSRGQEPFSYANGALRSSQPSAVLKKPPRFHFSPYFEVKMISVPAICEPSSRAGWFSWKGPAGIGPSSRLAARR